VQDVPGKALSSQRRVGCVYVDRVFGTAESCIVCVRSHRSVVGAANNGLGSDDVSNRPSHEYTVCILDGGPRNDGWRK
jgi:hypothetical protein